MLKNREPYQDLGYDYLDNRKKERQIQTYLVKLQQLGIAVDLKPVRA